jgi:hypothetical protein
MKLSEPQAERSDLGRGVRLGARRFSQREQHTQRQSGTCAPRWTGLRVAADGVQSACGLRASGARSDAASGRGAAAQYGPTQFPNSNSTPIPNPQCPMPAVALVLYNYILCRIGYCVFGHGKARPRAPRRLYAPAKVGDRLLLVPTRLRTPERVWASCRTQWKRNKK